MRAHIESCLSLVWVYSPLTLIFCFNDLADCVENLCLLSNMMPVHSGLAWVFLSPDCFQRERFLSSLPSPLKSQLHVPILFLCVIICNHKSWEYLNHLISSATFIFRGFIFSHTTISISTFCRAGETYSQKSPWWNHVDMKVRHAHFSVYNSLDRLISTLTSGYQIKLIHKI